MALIVADRVKEITTTTGTGAYTLGGAVEGFQAFSAVTSNGDTAYYAITDETDWEVGLGTYASAGGTLTRTTIFSSSNSGSAVNWGAGTKNIFLTYPAEKAVYEDISGNVDVPNNLTVGGTVDGVDIAARDADLTTTTNTANAALPKAGGTMTGNLVLNADPTASLQAATKQYVDTIAAAGIHYHTPARVEAPANLPSTYDNGTSGVGATLTNSGTQVAIVIDGVALSSADRVLIYQQTDPAHNGVYTVTTVGSVSTNWVLTRATDADSYGPSDPDALGQGDAFFISAGDTGAGETYVMTTVGTITFGTTGIVFTQISATAVYSAGTGMALAGTVFSIGQDVGIGDSPTFVNVSGTSGTFTTLTLGGTAVTATAAELNILDGVTATAAELNFVDGVTSNVQTQINTKVAKAGDTMTGDLSFGDNNKATFGAGSDLQIYHDGSNSYIDDAGNGDMLIRGSARILLRKAGTTENMIRAEADSYVKLYFDDAEKLATTATGIDVTGTVTATGTSVFASLDISGDIDVDGTTNLDVVDIDGAVDMASTLNVTGAVTGTSATLTTADNTTQLTLKSTDDDLNSGPELDFYRLSASPADNDYLGRVKYIGRNDNAQDVTAVDILARMVAVSDGTEEATYNIRVMKAGTLIDRVTLNETETILNEAGADLDFRVESDTVTHALFVDGANGNVGIGTSSPSSYGKLAVYNVTGDIEVACVTGGANYATYRLQNSSRRYSMQIRTDQGDAWTVRDETAGSNRMVIDTSGNVGIGTSSPSTFPAKLAVSGYVASGGQNYSAGFSDAVNTTFRIGHQPAVTNLISDAGMAFYTSSAERMLISEAGGLSVGTAADAGAGGIFATGNITAYYSDDRLKTKLGNIEGALNLVSQLNGFYYEANQTAVDLGYEVKREVGVSAQEVEAIMPEIVAPAPIDDKYLTVRYERLAPLLIEAIKELKDKVEALEAQIQGK
jgi:hypothetical protein